MLASIFVSHGSPNLALDAGEAGAAWRRIAASARAQPKAIVIVSAHWETEKPLLTGAAALATIHDFGGFPEALYRIEYPAPGAPDIARRAADLLRQADFSIALDNQRGLDHGAWVPLREMYPRADVPIVQLSLQPHLGPVHHYRMGRALAPLTAEDILLMGSGGLTHNLHEAFAAMRNPQSPALAYVSEFQQWLYHALSGGDTEALLSYRTRAPHAKRAHPSEEHLLPLFFALGAAGENPRVTREYTEIDLSALAMDVYCFEAR